MTDKKEKSSVLSQIQDFLEQLGWNHDAVASNIVRTHYHGQFGVEKVMVHIYDDGIMIAINPVLQQPSGGWSNSVGQLIQILTNEIHLIRVGIDDDGDVFVKVDLPSENLTFEEFVYVLINLCQVAEQLFVPILQAQSYDTHERTVLDGIASH